MVNLSIFEKLPAELHDLILEPLTLYDLINLSQVSRHFHNLITPRIYNSWTYNGRQHSSKSLQRFLRTVLENPQLGSLADTLDLREWGDCPRLEDDCHTKWYSGQGYSYQDFRPDEDEGDDSETDDGRQEAADDGDNNLEASKDESPEPDGPVRGNKTDEMYKEYIPLFQKAIEEIGFGECTGNYTTCHKCRLLGKDEDVLISLLIWSLPNLHTLYLVMPSDSQSDCTLPLPNAVTGMMARAVASGRTDFLQNLRTIYVCSALCKWISYYYAARCWKAYHSYVSRKISVRKVTACTSSTSKTSFHSSRSRAFNHCLPLQLIAQKARIDSFLRPNSSTGVRVCRNWYSKRPLSNPNTFQD